MSIYSTLKIKPNELPHYNNLMYNNIIFKLRRVNVKNLFNNAKNEGIFLDNIEKLNKTDRLNMLREIDILYKLLSSYATNSPKFNIEQFSKDANYDIVIEHLGETPIYSFTTKNTRIKVISIVDILNKCDSTKYISDRVKESYNALSGFRKLGKYPDGKKK